MLFWTLWFIILYGYVLVRGNFLAKPLNALTSTIIEVKEAEKAGSVLTEYDKNRLARKSLIAFILAIIPAIIIIIAEIIYFTTAIPLDPFKYPSFGMLVFVICNFVFIKVTTKESNLDTAEGLEKYRKEAKKVKRYTFWGCIVGLIKFVYFVYMFWALSFGI